MTQSTSGDSPNIAKSLDCRGLICPLPIYKTSATLAGLDDGEVLEVVCTDPASVADFEALARRTGHRLLKVEATQDQQSFWLRKGG